MSPPLLQDGFSHGLLDIRNVTSPERELYRLGVFGANTLREREGWPGRDPAPDLGMPILLNQAYKGEILG
jgi:hypothetical protein